MRCESVSALVRRKTTKRQKEPSRIYRFKVRLNVVVQEGEDLMNEKKKAWVYTRIDAPEDRYGSLKRQDQKLTEYASRMGWEVVGHSQATGSCRDMNRPGLQALTDAVSQGCVNILGVSGPDRLSRKAKDIIAYAEFLQNFDVEAYSPEQGKIEVLCTSVLKDSALAVPDDSPNLSIR